MEERGYVSDLLAAKLPELCEGFAQAGALLLAGIGTVRLSATLLDELTLLTLGPQLRGGANVRKGTAGIQTVFNAIHQIVQHSVYEMGATQIKIQNAAGRMVFNRVCTRSRYHHPRGDAPWNLSKTDRY